MKKKRIGDWLKREVNRICNYKCSYCGVEADYVINGIGYQFNPLHDRKYLKSLDNKFPPYHMWDVVALVSFEIDHRKAECRGGKTEINNLTLSCRRCNRSKGSGEIINGLD